MTERVGYRIVPRSRLVYVFVPPVTDQGNEQLFYVNSPKYVIIISAKELEKF